MGIVRARRVSSDPFDDRAKARLFGWPSDSSTSGGESDESPCLSKLVHGFFVDDDEVPSQLGGHESDLEGVESVPDRMDAIEALLGECFATSSSSIDSYRDLLLCHIEKAMVVFSSSSKSLLRRRVVSFLRDNGHNAAICKTRWESSAGLTSGNYEFIDVVRPGASVCQRYLIELDFAGEFEVARPTSRYSRLVQSLPRVFVCNSEDLKTLVKAMSEAAKISMKSRGLSLPPWRKSRYMQNKWLGPCHRSMNPSPAPVNGAAMCRWIGFENSTDGRLVLRTR